MKKIIKTISIIISILILIVIIFVNLPRLLDIVTNDISEVNLSGLELVIKNVPFSENGFYDLEEISSLLYIPEKQNGTTSVIRELHSGNNWDSELAEYVINKNEEALSYFSSASQKEGFQNPAYNESTIFSYELLLPKINDWRTISFISTIKSTILLNLGKNEEAMEEAMKSVKVGQKITKSNVTLIEYLVGLAIKDNGLAMVEKIINESNFDDEQVSKYIFELNEMYDTGDGLKNVFIVEHKFILNTIDLFKYDSEEDSPNLISEILASTEFEELNNIKNINISNNYYFRPNKTKQIHTDQTRKVINNINIHCDDIAYIEESKTLTPDNIIKFYLTENVIGKIFHDIIISKYHSIFQKRCNSNNQLDKILSSLK
jgi:hypothetical protein